MLYTENDLQFTLQDLTPTEVFERLIGSKNEQEILLKDTFTELLDLYYQQSLII